MHDLRDKPQNVEQDTMNEPTEINFAQARESAWDFVAPAWPLGHQVAVNPLQGLEKLPFEQALELAGHYFTDAPFDEEFEMINRITIKWCQAFFDQGQALVKVPFKSHHFYDAIKTLLTYDSQAHQNKPELKTWLAQLSDDPLIALKACIDKQGLKLQEVEQYCTLLLTSLPGWASYVKYLCLWDQTEHSPSDYVSLDEYLAIRAVIFCLVTDNARDMLKRHRVIAEFNSSDTSYRDMCEREFTLRDQLMTKIRPLEAKITPLAKNSDVDFLLCIDVRSEPMRRKLETIPGVQTFGCAGFFGLPIGTSDSDRKGTFAHCPALLAPQYKVPIGSKPGWFEQMQISYSAIKYQFTTPFVVAELLGPIFALHMTVRNYFSKLNGWMRRKYKQHIGEQDIAHIPLEEQATFAAQLLTAIGLTDHFADLVVLCGHESSSINNPFYSTLQCGACGGHSGLLNAQIMATILSNPEVRQKLDEAGISIPDSTTFLAAAHDTTTDEIRFEDSAHIKEAHQHHIDRITAHIKEGLDRQKDYKSRNWAEVRPEWGLSRNMAFLIAERDFSKHADLEGRVFMHDYYWDQDPDGKVLEAIMSAPMIVTQWINTQYLFSTFDNVAFGAGSKVTSNITGKIAMMQGNASDFMHGLSVQSVQSSDTENYHQPVRLQVVIHAPKERIGTIVRTVPKIEELIRNQWIFLLCFDPKEPGCYLLKKDLSWSDIDEHRLS